MFLVDNLIQKYICLKTYSLPIFDEDLESGIFICVAFQSAIEWLTQQSSLTLHLLLPPEIYDIMHKYIT